MSAGPLLDLPLPSDQAFKLAMGELTAAEVRTARSAYRLALAHAAKAIAEPTEAMLKAAKEDGARRAAGMPPIMADALAEIAESGLRAGLKAAVPNLER